MTIEQKITKKFNEIVEKIGVAKAIDILGVSRSQMSNYKSGANKVSEEILIKLAVSQGLEVVSNIFFVGKENITYDKKQLAEPISKLVRQVFDFEILLSNLEGDLDQEDFLFSKKASEFYEFLQTHSQYSEPERVADELGNTIGFKEKGFFIPLYD